MRSLERRLTVLEARKRQRKARPTIFIAAYDRMDADVIGFAGFRGHQVGRLVGEALTAFQRRAATELNSRIVVAHYASPAQPVLPPASARTTPTMVLSANPS